MAVFLQAMRDRKRSPHEFRDLFPSSGRRHEVERKTHWAYKLPMRNREIQNGGKLPVRDPKTCVRQRRPNGGRFGPTVTPQHANFAILTYLKIGTGVQVALQIRPFISFHANSDRPAGETQNPITIRGHEDSHPTFVSAVRHVTRITCGYATTVTAVSGTRDIYRARFARPVAAHPLSPR